MTDVERGRTAATPSDPAQQQTTPAVEPMVPPDRLALECCGPNGQALLVKYPDGRREYLNMHNPSCQHYHGESRWWLT